MFLRFLRDALSIFSNPIFLSAILLISTILASIAVDLHAETTVKIDDVRNELLKASLPKSKVEGQNLEDQKISNEDLIKAEKRLKAAEARLISQQQSASLSITPKLPQEDLEQYAESESSGTLTERIITKSRTPDKPIALKGASKQPKQEITSGEKRGAIDVEKVLSALDKANQNAEQESQPSTLNANTNDRNTLIKMEELQKRNNELELEQKISQEKMSAIAKELDETRNRLMIAETQVERLSSIIESRGRDITTRKSNSLEAPETRPAPPLYKPRVESSAADMQVATVIVDKAHLRTGPGRENSPLMAITKGTRLAVETRSGDWYRVIAPSGVRAWVSSDVVAFGIDPMMNPSKAGITKGFDSSTEE